MRLIKNHFSNPTVVIISVLVFSCSPTREEQTIMDFEQNINGTKTDLSMKIQTLEQIGVVTAADSSAILEAEIKSVTENEIVSRKKRLTKSLSGIRTYTILNDKVEIERLKELMRTDTLAIKYYENGELEKTLLADRFLKNKAYKVKPDSTLLTKYKCTYTIKNPFLNNVEQELTKLYYMTNNGKIATSETLGR